VTVKIIVSGWVVCFFETVYIRHIFTTISPVHWRISEGLCSTAEFLTRRSNIRNSAVEHNLWLQGHFPCNWRLLSFLHVRGLARIIGNLMRTLQRDTHTTWQSTTFSCRDVLVGWFTPWLVMLWPTVATVDWQSQSGPFMGEINLKGFYASLKVRESALII